MVELTNIFTLKNIIIYLLIINIIAFFAMFIDKKKAEKTNNSNSQSLEKTDFTVLSGKIVIKMKSAYKNTWMNHMEELNECKTIEELEKFIETYKLFDKKGELLNINSD